MEEEPHKKTQEPTTTQKSTTKRKRNKRKKKGLSATNTEKVNATSSPTTNDNTNMNVELNSQVFSGKDTLGNNYESQDLMWQAEVKRKKKNQAEFEEDASTWYSKSGTDPLLPIRIR